MFLFTNAIHLLPYTGAGSGIRRALEYDPDVVFSNRTNEFIITISRKSNQVSNQVSQKSNQETQKSNQETLKSNQENKYIVTRELTKKEEDICNFCSVPRTAQEIMERLGVSNQSKNRQKFIVPLIEIGVLERTIPDNPKDRNQKYRRRRN